MARGVVQQSGARVGAEQRKSGETLVEMVSRRLREAISSGTLKPGDRLPTEGGLTQEYDVSRTVIREAIASLRADGLVEARHGVGVFVLAPQAGPYDGFRSADPNKISSLLEMLELRAAIEIEAAGLAAIRRSPAQEEAILESYDEIDRLKGDGKPTVEADRAFHLAIADSTSNPRFREFLQLIGKQMIPRGLLADGDNERSSEEYLLQIQAEHLRIARAISDQDEGAAREAMRLHLKGSQQRYRHFIKRG
ncbi:FadR/GntR family transcriptional regulator [Rhizobium sp. BK251]|uniref:FadR/GntR family transcriptional regulator n=1 Tax=Rhizobium sp. BK251 TaxID=2512125 RepID=UPI0010D3D3FC|nr:FadR/GntR family transcriptional regulator [Rhizobium sp. BK251]TCL73841.1 GntR family transcriptional regulator [Rhizobium sp. BK251]